jgi:hypothetical protein
VKPTSIWISIPKNAFPNTVSPKKKPNHFLLHQIRLVLVPSVIFHSGPLWESTWEMNSPVPPQVSKIVNFWTKLNSKLPKKSSAQNAPMDIF